MSDPSTPTDRATLRLAVFALALTAGAAGALVLLARGGN
jgi:hypothetical protein